MTADSKSTTARNSASSKLDFYQEFNAIQHNFYTSIPNFRQYTNYELKKHGYVLLSNLAKGFPHLSEMISNLYGVEWKAIESAAILRALQFRLLGQYGGGNARGFASVPQFIYFKNLKPEAEKKERKSKKTENGLIFDDMTRADIMSLLMIDSKTYEYLKFSLKIQSLGEQLTMKNPIKQVKK